MPPEPTSRVRSHFLSRYLSGEGGKGEGALRQQVRRWWRALRLGAGLVEARALRSGSAGGAPSPAAHHVVNTLATCAKKKERSAANNGLRERRRPSARERRSGSFVSSASGNRASRGGGRGRGEAGPSRFPFARGRGGRTHGFEKMVIVPRPSASLAARENGPPLRLLLRSGPLQRASQESARISEERSWTGGRGRFGGE